MVLSCLDLWNDAAAAAADAEPQCPATHVQSRGSPGDHAGRWPCPLYTTFKIRFIRFLSSA